MKTIVDFVLARLRERSTWVGLIGILSTVGIALKPDMAEALTRFGVALAGLVLVVTKEPPAN